MKIVAEARENKMIIPSINSSISFLILLLTMVGGSQISLAADATGVVGSNLPAVSSPALAQGTATNSAALGANPIAAPTTPSMVPTPTASQDSSPAPSLHDDSTNSPIGSGGSAKVDISTEKKTEKNLTKLEDKVNDGAKDVVKRLATAPADMTLDDLNAAKVAVAKIDALIEIEKHLADLDKIRADRNKDSSTSQVPQIAASAFQPPPVPTFQPPMNQIPTFDSKPIEMAVTPPVMFNSEPEITRISGINGNYVATISLPGGQTKTVHVGDKWADGSFVTSITATGMTVLQQAKKKQIDVKGVDKVYGRSL
jgi:type IV pilus biogenesis protein PilP